MRARHIFSDPDIRRQLAEPIGSLVSENAAVRIAADCNEEVLAVGDVVSRTLLERGIRPRIIIFDEKTRRMPSGEFPSNLLGGYCIKMVKNPPGTVSEEAYLELKRLISISGEFALKVSGEEDLLGLPAIELAPVGSLVFYGQPNKGIVFVHVDPETKGIARSLLEKSRVG